MEHHDNDNEPDSFIQLGLATALLLNRIRNSVTLLELSKRNEEKDVERAADRDSGRRNENSADEHARAVDQRLRDFSAFERRASGNKD